MYKHHTPSWSKMSIQAMLVLIWVSWVRPAVVIPGTRNITHVEKPSCNLGTPLANCPYQCLCWTSSKPCQLTITCTSQLESEQMAAIDDMLTSELCGLTLKIPRLGKLPNAVCNLTDLQKLDVRYCDLHSLPQCMRNLVLLKHFDACHNHIKILPKNLFAGMNKLVSVQLSSNELVYVDPFTFGDFNDMTHLRVIMMDSNYLTSIEVFLPVMSGGVFGVAYNQISTLTNNFNISAKLTDIRTGKELSPKIHVDATHNKLTHLVPLLNQLLPNWSALDMAILGRSMKFDIARNVFHCDCVDFYFYSLLRLSKVADARWFCSSPTQLRGQRIVAIPLVQFICPLVTDCDKGLICDEVPFYEIIRIRSENTSLTVLPHNLPSPRPDRFPLLPFTFNLHLNGSHITELDDRYYWKNTSVIDLSNSTINRINPTALYTIAQHASELYLHDNKLTHLPRDIMNMTFNLELLTLHGNPWACSCNDMWMVDWFGLLRQQGTVIKQDEMICDSPNNMRGMSMAYLDDHILACKQVIKAKTMNLK